jgi:hypothetical protein
MARTIGYLIYGIIEGLAGEKAAADRKYFIPRDRNA